MNIIKSPQSNKSNLWAATDSCNGNNSNIYFEKKKWEPTERQMVQKLCSAHWCSNLFLFFLAFTFIVWMCMGMCVCYFIANDVPAFPYKSEAPKGFPCLRLIKWSKEGKHDFCWITTTEQCNLLWLMNKKKCVSKEAKV